MIGHLESHARESVGCRVEARDRLVILVPDAPSAVRLNADERTRMIQLARAEGFTHVAVELDPDVASLPGD